MSIVQSLSLPSYTNSAVQRFCHDKKILLPALYKNGESISMGQAKKQQESTESNTKNLVRYGIQLAMLNSLLSHKLITEKEYRKVSEQLRGDYGIASVA